MILRRAIVPACFALAGAACGGAAARPPPPPHTTPAPPPPRATTDAAAAPPLFDDLGSYHRPIATTSATAQRYFDQGIVLVYAFNHDEAARDFAYAARLDPACAMCFFGVALANGPHINNPALDEPHARAAYDAVTAARRLVANVDDAGIEHDLVEALAARYAADPAAPRKPLDRAYADAMRGVFRTHPEDADAGALFAEALMDLRPWDLWTREGAPQDVTPEILSTLEAVLARAPDHPGANHFYIHATEASPHPERALASAERLRTLVPGAGHLVHMPSHVYIRVGRYGDAIDANLAAIRADDDFARRAPPLGMYPMYRAHNYAFLWVSAMYAGSSALALQGARGMLTRVPPGMFEAMPGMGDAMADASLLAMVRFARWDEILAEPPIDERMVLASLVQHMARGLAYIAKGDMFSANQERFAAYNSYGMIPAYAVFGVASEKRDVGDVALQLLDGEFAVHTHLSGSGFQTELGITRLRKAVEAEDRLAYDEPPDWVLPARHWLGAELLAAGRPADAEAVYRDDLARHPENGWSLLGLAQALDARGDAAGAAAVRERYTRAWSRADVILTASRL
jgi:tetratricopeptide (TPR) repeat protein